jgi:hypothetical protein
MNLTSRLKIDPNLEERFLDIGVLFGVGTAKISTTSICYTLDPDPSVNSLGPKFCSRPLASLDFRVSLVLDLLISSVDPLPKLPMADLVFQESRDTMTRYFKKFIPIP